MRKDMFKVIVERPRRGADFRVNRSRLAGEDDLPSRVGMKRFRTLNRTKSKWLNENLAPLNRYLMKQAGRPWRKVYSEICENLDANNTVKRHVRDHLQDFVVTKVGIGRKGEWMNGNEWPGGRMSDTPWRQPLYVDPYDGILKRSDKLWKKMRVDPTPHWRKRCNDPSKADPSVRRIDDTTELHCIGGIWYEIKFRKRANAKPTDFTYDKLTHQPVWPGKRHAYSKSQLSAAALAAFNLENQPQA
ncbi:MAG: hypothetical protein AAGC77_14045 [Pseudomonadota bacterium]